MLFTGIENMSVIASEVDLPITVRDHVSVRATSQYRIVESIVHEFDGVHQDGEAVSGGTDGDFTISLRTLA